MTAETTAADFKWPRKDSQADELENHLGGKARNSNLIFNGTPDLWADINPF